MIAAILLGLVVAPSVSMSSEAMKAQSRLALASYGDCLVARKGDAVRVMLAQPYDDRVSKASRALNDTACPFATPTTTFDPRLVEKLDGVLLRSVLYQALLRREPARIGTTPPVADAQIFPIGRNWPGSPAMNYLSLIESGQCLLGKDAINARQLVLAPIDSDAEAQAMTALAKPFGQCGWRGEEKYAARGILAEIYYRAGEPAGVQ